MPATYLRSSTFRLALIYASLFGVSVLILLGFIYWSTAAYMADQTDATIEAEITGLAERYERDGLGGLTELVRDRLSRRTSGSSIYLLTTAALTPLIGNLDRWPDGETDADGWWNFRLEDAGGGRNGVYLARARSFRLSGGFLLLVGRDVRELTEIRSTIIRTLVWGLVITIVLAGLGGAMMSRSTVRRIESINTTSRDIMSGDLSRRIPTDGTGDDFDTLASNLNQMLDRIQLLMDDVRRVSDNVAHDLRTPLARLRNRLETLKLESDASETGRQIIDQALTDTNDLLTTFNALLRIARLETDQSRGSFRELDMATLILDVSELYEPLAHQRKQQIVLGPMEAVRMAGDRDLLFQALANLLDNAIKYTPEGGRISISLNHKGDNAELTLGDTGPGVPIEAREKVFQRFFRLDESRSTPGNGLGLSLVAAVARLHRIGLSLEDNDPGLRVVLRLRLQDA